MTTTVGIITVGMVEVVIGRGTWVGREIVIAEFGFSSQSIGNTLDFKSHGMGWKP